MPTKQAERALLKAIGYVESDIFPVDATSWRDRWLKGTGIKPSRDISKLVQIAHPSDKRRRNGKWISGE